MWRVLFFVVAASCIVDAESYRDCTEEGGSVESVKFQGVEASDDIIFIKPESNFTITIDFNINHTVSLASVEIYGSVHDVAFFGIELNDTNVCEDKTSGLSCPLFPDDGPFTYTKSFTLSNFSLPLNYTLATFEISLVDGAVGNIMCIEFDVDFTKDE